jgi:hypothetical protein
VINDVVLLGNAAYVEVSKSRASVDCCVGLSPLLINTQ